MEIVLQISFSSFTDLIFSEFRHKNKCMSCIIMQKAVHNIYKLKYLVDNNIKFCKINARKLKKKKKKKHVSVTWLFEI